MPSLGCDASNNSSPHRPVKFVKKGLWDGVPNVGEGLLKLLIVADFSSCSNDASSHPKRALLGRGQVSRRAKAEQ